ncbi:hypothetical protein F5884DRAFT_904244 [Xylogone sp. PMI_703]|nr:hypothetical protein F5884DRAFT_904244 [Xylogone sp. PMI_703]
MSAFFSQSFPPKPTFTERELGDLTGKVLIITGGYSGVGYQLTKIVYAKNAVVYVAGRRESEGLKAIDEMKAACPNSKGRLEFLPLDLADLSSIKKSVDTFLTRENRLDILWNNAGLMGTSKDMKSKQGHELILATNCIGPFLFTKLLHPILVSTATSAPPGSVRVIWLGSIVIQLQAPKAGMDIDNLDYKKKSEDDATRYAISKAGNLFIGCEWARRDAKSGVMHLTLNPGNLKTPLQRNMGCLERHITNLMLHDPIYGAYTELWAGLSPAVKPSDSGRYIIPWGRFGDIREDVAAACKSAQEGGLGKATQFFEYCEKVTRDYC